MRTRASRELRKNSTIPERILWGILFVTAASQLRNSASQHCVGPYIVDYYCASARLVVELDGRSHDDRGNSDRERQEYLEYVARLSQFSESEMMTSLTTQSP